MYSKKDYICFGDPGMQIYTQKPSCFGNVEIVRHADSIVVNTNEPSAQIAFYNKSNGNVVTYRGTHACSTLSGDSVIVCLSAPNRIPFIQNPMEDLYIQNTSINGTKTYHAKKIFVGSNVTNNEEPGAVTFSNGKMVLEANEVELHGETTISTGTEFEIKIRH